MAKAAAEKTGTFREVIKNDFRRNYRIYLLALPVLLYYLIFCYTPLFGTIIAFKNYSPALGIFKSPWVGLANFKDFFSSYYLIAAFVGERLQFLQDPKYFRTIYIITDIWQGIGWDSIIYMAALSDIDQELYDAAYVDGAGRFRQLFCVTLPSILPTIMVLLIIKIGSVMNLGYKKIILPYNEAIYETADVISSFIYIYDGFLVVSINKNRFRDVAVAVYPDSAYLVFDGRGKMIFSTPEGFDEKTVSDAVKSSKNGELKLSGKRYFINELYSTVNSLEYISITAGDTAFRRLLKSWRTMAAAYMKSFKLTPCTTVEAHKENSSTLWFNSRFHRSNLYIHDKKIFLRDIFVFNENYRERYFDEVTENKNLYFDNLPVIDCFRWSNKGKIGGGFFEKNSKQAAVIKDFSVQKNSGSSVCVMLALCLNLMKA